MKHIKLYLIALVIACSMLMVCPFASAESATDFLDSFALNNGFIGSSYEQTFNNARTECPYWVLCSSGSLQCIYFCSQPFTEDCFIWNSGYVFSYPGFLSATTYHTLTEDTVCYAFCFNNSDVSSYPACIYRRFYSSGTTAQNNLNNNPFKPRYNPTTENIIAGSTSQYLNTYSTYTNSSYDAYVNYSYNSYGVFDATNELISYTDDARLKLYKLWSSQNGDSLVVDLSEFRTYTAAAAYNFSNIVLTITCNGVDTQYTLPLSSSTINNGWDNSSNLYTISTPINDFTLSDTYDTYITKVSFTLDYSSPGGSGTTPFYVSTNFPLDVHHSSIMPDVIPTPAIIYDDPAKPIDISDRQYDLFQQLQSNVAGGDIVYVNNYPVLPSWANVYNLNTFFYNNNPDDLNIYHGAQITGTYFIDSKYDFDIKSFLYDNAISAYYDVVIIRIDNTVWPSVVTNNTIPDSQQLYGYVVLYTSTYYMRLDAETQINILEAIQLDAKQSIENWNWLVEKMDDFENKSLEILNPLYDETTYIDDKLASILYAVNNIESYNDSSIVTLLNDIKGLLSSPENEIDTPQECIQLYEAHPNYFNELWGTPTPAIRSTSATPSPNNPYISSDYVRAELIPAWWEGKTLTMVYILKNDGDTSRFYDSILGGLFDAYENLIESDSSFTNYIDSLFKTGYDYTDSFYGHLFDLDYNPEEWEGGFGASE